MVSDTHTLEALRSDFDTCSKYSLSLPIAGFIVWFAIGALGTFLSLEQGVLALIVLTGAIFPLALLIAKLRGEELLNNSNPFAKLMALAVLMVNLLWAIHIPLFISFPALVPVSIGVGLGLHWIVYSWIIQNPLGTIHAVTRAVGLAFAWFFARNHIVTASAVVVCVAYMWSIWMMNKRAKA
ncbi:hypothetical protein MASR1M8_08620 [Thermomonas brevis]